MPVYVCRWPNGDCPLVQARTTSPYVRGASEERRPDRSPPRARGVAGNGEPPDPRCSWHTGPRSRYRVEPAAHRSGH